MKGQHYYERLYKIVKMALKSWEPGLTVVEEMREVQGRKGNIEVETEERKRF